MRIFMIIIQVGKGRILIAFDDMIADSTHYLSMKIRNKRELKNIAINHSAHIDYQDFMKICRECTKKPFSFLTIDTMLPASNPLRFRENLFQSL